MLRHVRRIDISQLHGPTYCGSESRAVPLSIMTVRPSKNQLVTHTCIVSRTHEYTHECTRNISNLVRDSRRPISLIKSATIQHSFLVYCAIVIASYHHSVIASQSHSVIQTQHDVIARYRYIHKLYMTRSTYDIRQPLITGVTSQHHVIAPHRCDINKLNIHDQEHIEYASPLNTSRVRRSYMEKSENKPHSTDDNDKWPRNINHAFSKCANTDLTG